MRARALKALARREHSRRELRDKLLPHAQGEDEVEGLLDDFEKRGWLSEARFAEQVATVRRRKYGAGRILGELREKGVSEAALEQARVRLRRDELAAARTVWQKKFGAMPGTLAEKAKQARFLAGRGFSAEVVHAVLKGRGDE
ncbi:MAG TPA: recombination regulator RecX [Burkholderiales bacterium]|nr:recombination regulator RecX [Burkholderiales bacterium]